MVPWVAGPWIAIDCEGLQPIPGAIWSDRIAIHLRGWLVETLLPVSTIDVIRCSGCRNIGFGGTIES
jgi:hypothetical protein